MIDFAKDEVESKLLKLKPRKLELRGGHYMIDMAPPSLQEVSACMVGLGTYHELATVVSHEAPAEVV